MARRSVAEGVADHIRQLVFFGELRDGERVPQREIAEALGVSSVPVREALASLQREGVVTIEPNRGAFVNGLDADVVKEQFYIFGRIYGLATRITTERAEPSVIAALSDLAERIGAERDLDALLGLSIEFQMRIVDQGGSKRLRALITPFSRIVPGNFYVTIPGSAEVTRRGVAEMAEADRVGSARRRRERLLAPHRRDRRARRATVPLIGTSEACADRPKRKTRGESLEDRIHPLRGQRADRVDHAEPSAGGQRPDARAARRPRRGVADGGRRPRRARDRPAGQRQALLRRPRHPRRRRRRRGAARSSRSRRSTRSKRSASSSTRCAGETFPKPSIAAVQGVCIAGGLLLCWPCDLIIAADNAKFSDPVVSMGIGGVEYHGHTWEWGARKAKEMLFTGRAMTAQEAEAIGMVTRVVPARRAPHPDARAGGRDRDAPSVRAPPGEARGEPDPRRAGLLRGGPVGLRDPPERARQRAQRIGSSDPDAARRA